MPEKGLTSEQAKKLLDEGYGNVIEDSTLKSTGRIIRENTLTFFNFVFVILAVLLATVGRFGDMAFLFLAAINSLIGIVQQIRSRNELSKLKVLSESKVKVIRDDVLVEIPTHEIVECDLIELSAGNQVPADGVVTSGKVQVNEALLTGEADLITKQTGDLLMSGSFVVSGKCHARMEKVGMESYAAQLTSQAKESRKAKKTGMMRSLDRLIKVIGFALVPIGLALFYNGYVVNGSSFSETIPSVVAALVGMIPEGLYLLTSMALAVSVMRLAKDKVLVHDMSAIETLARVDVLCVDKTGTITSSEMKVGQFICLKEKEYPRGQVENLLSACYNVLSPENDTGRAMAAYFSNGCIWPSKDVIPFTSENKWSAVVFEEHGTCIIGAPDFILGESYGLLEPLVKNYQKDGCRVLLAAVSKDAPIQGQLSGEAEPIALVIIENPVRPDAPETFQYFAEQGVAVKVISGDNPASVSRIALQAGIEGADAYVDASALVTAKDYAKAVKSYNVFGRVTPEQKRMLIKAFQKAGHTVAMTGDGVNDVLALKDADCGIAMASGADAACQAAKLVLVNSEFSALPKVVDEGRRVINNIQRSASLYLVKNIMSFFLSLITVFAGFPYPFVPIQLTLVSSLTIGIPSFVLALEPNHDRVSGKFMRNVLRRALPGGLTNIVLLTGIELFAVAFQFDQATLSTLSTVIMGMVGLLVLYDVSKPMDWKRWGLWGIMTAGMIFTFVYMHDIFEISPINLQSGLVTAVFLLLVPTVMGFFERLFVLAGTCLDQCREKMKFGFRKRKTE